jgi:orotate phosphoribosyltransferase
MNLILRKYVEELCKLEGEFILSSGKTSNYYFDKYLMESNPKLLREVAQEIINQLPLDRGEWKFDYFAGLDMGGIPLATILSQITLLPTLFVRKKRKEYGTKKIAEGPNFDGQWVCIVEDVITSGTQVVESFQKLINDGAKVETVVCAILRDNKGRERIESCGLNLYTAFDFTENDG